MEKRIEIPKSPAFHWLPKHLNHITENVVFKKRNVSFLAINKVFRQKETHTIKASKLGNDHFEIEDFVGILPNDLLRQRAEKLKVLFRFDNHQNIIVVTAISENDRD
jgi:hypothetical protein